MPFIIIAVLGVVLLAATRSSSRSSSSENRRPRSRGIPASRRIDVLSPEAQELIRQARTVVTERLSKGVSVEEASTEAATILIPDELPLSDRQIAELRRDAATTISRRMQPSPEDDITERDIEGAMVKAAHDAANKVGELVDVSF